MPTAKVIHSLVGNQAQASGSIRDWEAGLLKQSKIIRHRKDLKETKEHDKVAIIRNCV